MSRGRLGVGTGVRGGKVVVALVFACVLGGGVIYGIIKASPPPLDPAPRVVGAPAEGPPLAESSPSVSAPAPPAGSQPDP